MVRHLHPQLTCEVKLGLALHTEQVLGAPQDHRVDLPRSVVGLGHASYAQSKISEINCK